jgi:uncharacterized membrane protein
VRSFATTIDIAAPGARVWEVLTDVERWQEWTPSITSVKRLDSGPFGMGSRARILQPKLLPAVWRVIAIEPGTSFAWVSTAPGVRVVGSHSIMPTPSGVTATIAVELQGILSGLFGWLTGAVTERYIAYEAKGLKLRSENPSYRHGDNHLPARSR